MCADTFQDMVPTRGETHKCSQRSPKRTYLFDDALYHAIGSRCDLPVTSPSDIENAADGMNEIKDKKGELAMQSVSYYMEAGPATTETYHVNIGGSPKQLPVTIFKHVSVT